MTVSDMPGLLQSRKNFQDMEELGNEAKRGSYLVKQDRTRSTNMKSPT